ncbi:hypothetical protein AGMMS49944_07430 [Spirochaetia bacterium]|nr:hypothetical protein AGMMS49944_07430 [Spirochaetia bacterium]
MSITHTNITLKNAIDVGEAKRGLIAPSEVRETAVRALADTGAGTLVINDWVLAKLGLRIKGLKRITLGNNYKEIFRVTEPVEVHWNDREMSCDALVAPNDGPVLLGAIPMEDMDLMVCPKSEEVIGAHGDEAITLVM